MRPFPHLVALTMLALALLCAFPAASASAYDPDALIRDAHARACHYVPDTPVRLDALHDVPDLGVDVDAIAWDVEEPSAFCERNVGNVFIPGGTEIA